MSSLRCTAAEAAVATAVVEVEVTVEAVATAEEAVVSFWMCSVSSEKNVATQAVVALGALAQTRTHSQIGKRRFRNTT